MTITNLAARMEAFERRLLLVEHSVQALDRRVAELDALKQALGDLKLEIEDRRE